MDVFYLSIADYYEDIFRVNEKQLQFLSSSAQGKRVLDVACATGSVASALGSRGFDVTGIDLSEAMIQRAIKKERITAFVRSMLDLDGLGEPFDLVYCIGNSVPHLDNEEEIMCFFSQCYGVLRSGAKLVIQIINFTNFWREPGDSLGALPTIENDRVKFERQYFRDNHKIRFHTKLTAGGHSLINDALLYPIMPQRCMDLLRACHFTNIEIYAGFDESAFHAETALSVVLRAKKP